MGPYGRLCYQVLDKPSSQESLVLGLKHLEFRMKPASALGMWYARYHAHQTNFKKKKFYIFFLSFKLFIIILISFNKKQKQKKTITKKNMWNNKTRKKEMIIIIGEK